MYPVTQVGVSGVKNGRSDDGQSLLLCSQQDADFISEGNPNYLSRAERLERLKEKIEAFKKQVAH